MRQDEAHPLVDDLVAALNELATAPQARTAAQAAIVEVEQIWLGQRFTLGVAGDAEARARFINHACGRELLDPQARTGEGPTLRIRRTGAARVRGVRGDGATEEPTLSIDLTEINAVDAHVEELHAFIATKRSELAGVEQSLPVRPAVWAIWLWPIYWLRRWLARDRLLARTRLLAEVAEPERELARCQSQKKHLADTPDPIAAAVRRLCATDGIRTIDVSIVEGKLDRDVSLVEMLEGSRMPVDAAITVAGQKATTIAANGRSVSLGDFDAAIAALPALGRHGRALRIGLRYRSKIAATLTNLVNAIDRKEASFDERLERLAQLRLVDPGAFVEGQLDEVRPHIVVSIQAVMEHAATHLGSELAEVTGRWLGTLDATDARGELRGIAGSIEGEWVNEMRRIAGDVRVLVEGGIKGCACDLYPQVVEPLRSHGLPSEHATLRSAPPVTRLALLPTLEAAPPPQLLDADGRIAGLFRSLANRRGRIRDRLAEDLADVTRRASSELLSAEPNLHTTLSAMIAAELGTAIRHQVAWLERAESDEQAAIAAERARLAPFVGVRDAVSRKLERISREIARLEADPLAR
jgi:hypothetical protein